MKAKRIMRFKWHFFVVSKKYNYGIFLNHIDMFISRISKTTIEDCMTTSYWSYITQQMFLLASRWFLVTESRFYPNASMECLRQFHFSLCLPNNTLINSLSSLQTLSYDQYYGAYLIHTSIDLMVLLLSCFGFVKTI